MVQVTMGNLEYLIGRVNDALGTNPDAYEWRDGKSVAHVGTVYLTRPNKGYGCEQITSETGTSRNMFAWTCMSKRELYGCLSAFMTGLIAANWDKAGK